MKETKHIMNCSQFEELLTDYLDKTLETAANTAVAEHALACPLCHSLLNEVKDSLELCRQIAAPASPLTRLEARVLSMTMPETAMACENFEDHLTDYLDGFLPAAVFHRWERHAALCTTCEDLPGMVVRSIGACYTYKMDEMAVPAGLHQRILNLTLGTEHAREVKASLAARVGEWARGLRFPVGIPQFAPVAMLLMIAFLVFSQTVSADGSLAGIYQKSLELAESTYQQSADAWNGKPVDVDKAGRPIDGTTTIANEEDK
ncbi:MAG: zf-HC2 domain-containing protein [Chloracidobacterium sp.]|nr:zf-HC2 domain-containing protein [Chloracidobacterium sp.]